MSFLSYILNSIFRAKSSKNTWIIFTTKSPHNLFFTRYILRAAFFLCKTRYQGRQKTFAISVAYFSYWRWKACVTQFSPFGTKNRWHFNRALKNVDFVWDIWPPLPLSHGGTQQLGSLKIECKNSLSKRIFPTISLQLEHVIGTHWESSSESSKNFKSHCVNLRVIRASLLQYTKKNTPLGSGRFSEAGRDFVQQTQFHYGKEFRISEKKFSLTFLCKTIVPTVPTLNIRGIGANVAPLVPVDPFGDDFSKNKGVD